MVFLIIKCKIPLQNNYVQYFSIFTIKFTKINESFLFKCKSTTFAHFLINLTIIPFKYPNIMFEHVRVRQQRQQHQKCLHGYYYFLRSIRSGGF